MSWGFAAILRLRRFDWTDFWFYGVAPLLVYLLLGSTPASAECDSIGCGNHGAEPSYLMRAKCLELGDLSCASFERLIARI